MITDTNYKKNIDLPFTIEAPANGRSGESENRSAVFNQLVHDLKSPVNSLKGIIRLANLQIADEQAREFFLMINECVDKLEDKIINTLDMFEKGNLIANVERLDFQSVIYEVMISLGHIDGFEKVKFSTSVNTVKPFYSSRPLIESVLQNLIENAIKYRCMDKEVCTVTIEINDTGSGVAIHVSDNGLGIERKRLPYIFNGILKSEIKRNDSHGLGLFIVKRAVEKMNGSIKVASRVGVGTSFTIDLPNLYS